MINMPPEEANHEGSLVKYLWWRRLLREQLTMEEH